MAHFTPRRAMARAQFFVQKAVDCPAHQRDDFEAYLDAAILFARMALLRLHTRYKKRSTWDQKWWEGVLSEKAVKFFTDKHHGILHVAPPMMPQGTCLGRSPISAADLYYYETPDIAATSTVARHLQAMETIVLEAHQRFHPS